jgi:enamine deaminase RidA (YjgF/YER057c/UK114 family)
MSRPQRSGLVPGVMHSMVEHSGTLFFAGITAGGEQPDDIAAQTRLVLEKIDALLAANGVAKDRLLTAVLFITDLSLRPLANAEWTAWLPEGEEPARTSLGAVALMPGELIEIQVTAAAAGSGPILRHGRNPGTYHTCVEHNGLLHFSGCSMHDESQDMATQTEGALARLTERLTERGVGKDHLLSSVVFVDDMDQLPQMNDVYGTWMTLDPAPARALVGCDLGEGTRFTIMATAATEQYPVERLGEAVRHNGEREPSDLFSVCFWCSFTCSRVWPLLRFSVHPFNDCSPRCAGRLYVRGTVGIVDVDGVTLLDNEHDMGDQTRAAMARVDKILREGGSSSQSVLSATLYVTGPGMEKKPAMNAAWGNFFPAGCEPARATIAIETMGALRLIEFSGVAAVDDSAKL